jgi:hypothetical protein
MLPVVVSSIFPVHNVMPEIVKKMAALAKRCQVYEQVVVFIAIQVSDSKYNDSSSIVLYSLLIFESIPIYRRMNPIPLKVEQNLRYLLPLSLNNYFLVSQAAELATVMVTLQY